MAALITLCRPGSWLQAPASPDKHCLSLSRPTLGTRELRSSSVLPPDSGATSTHAEGFPERLRSSGGLCICTPACERLMTAENTVSTECTQGPHARVNSVSKDLNVTTKCLQHTNGIERGRSQYLCAGQRLPARPRLPQEPLPPCPLSSPR